MTEDEKRELADVYEEAAEAIERDGWTQGELVDHKGRRCFIGGLVAATNNQYNRTYAAGVYAEQVLELPPRDSRCEGIVFPIAEWNDEKGRTKDEVINLLHGLANKLR